MFSLKLILVIASFIFVVVIHGNENAANANTEVEDPKKSAEEKTPVDVADSSASSSSELSGTLKDLFNGLTTEQRQQVHNILQDKSLTKQQISDQIKAFAGGIGEEAQQKFTAAIEQFQAKHNEAATKLNEKISSMGEGAKTIGDKITQISNNMSLTFEQEQQQIKDALASAPDDLKKKIESSELFGGMKAIKDKITKKLK